MRPLSSNVGNTVLFPCGKRRLTPSEHIHSFEDPERSLRKISATLFISTKKAALLSALYFKLRISHNWEVSAQSGQTEAKRRFLGS